jgi:hypothetical protein
MKHRRWSAHTKRVWRVHLSRRSVTNISWDSSSMSQGASSLYRGQRMPLETLSVPGKRRAYSWRMLGANRSLASSPGGKNNDGQLE